MKQRVLVLGASLKPERYSYTAIQMLVEEEQEVFAVGLREGTVEGVQIQSGMPLIEDLDTITLYIGPKNQPPFYEYLVSLKPKRVIFNPGTENSELQSLLGEHNIGVEIACTLVLLRTNQFELV